jgi:hypothetical protein
MNDVATAKEKWYHDIKHGITRCPVCDRNGVVYTLRLNRTMVRGLIWLESELARMGAEWVDVPAKAPRWVVRSNQLSSLAKWDLVRRRPKPLGSESKARYSGLWQLTTQGEAFRDGVLALPDRAFVYNDIVQGYSHKMVKIHECFETYFDYQEAVNARGNV